MKKNMENQMKLGLLATVIWVPVRLVHRGNPIIYFIYQLWYASLNP